MKPAFNTIRWKNAATDPLPVDGQQVLLSINGVNHVARYNTGRKTFFVTDDECGHTPIAGDGLIYWAEPDIH